MATVFSSGALGYFAIKVRHGQHLLMCSWAWGACKARRSDHALGLVCALGPNGQLHPGILLEQSPYIQLAEWPE